MHNRTTLRPADAAPKGFRQSRGSSLSAMTRYDRRSISSENIRYRELIGGFPLIGIAQGAVSFSGESLTLGFQYRAKICAPRPTNPGRGTIRLCVSSFADRVLDVGLALVEARFKIKVRGCSDNPSHSSKLSGATRDVSDLCGGELLRVPLHDASSLGEELIAVLHHVHEVERVRTIPIVVVCNAASPALENLNPIDDRRVGRKGVVKLENSDYMIGTISYVNIKLLRVFGVFRRNLEGNLLLLLGKHTAPRQRDNQTKQCSRD
jgi:hypothetical protein